MAQKRKNERKEFLEPSKNENTKQNLVDKFKTVLGEKFIALIDYIKKS